MKEVKVEIKKLENFDPSFDLPFYATPEAAGLDIKACLPKDLEIKPFQRVLIPTGIAVAIPVGYEIQVRPRSGLSYKTGLMVANSPGTIDSDYRGELKVILVNLSDKTEIVKHGERVGQILLAPVYKINWSEVQSLSDTQRSSGGFGSTGK